MKEKARFFKALGDETRLKIVSYLLKEDYCACGFTSGINKDQTTISRHLKVLVEAGILKYEKKGRNIIYSIKDDETKNFLKGLGIPGFDYHCNVNCCIREEEFH